MRKYNRDTSSYYCYRSKCVHKGDWKTKGEKKKERKDELWNYEKLSFSIVKTKTATDGNLYAKNTYISCYVFLFNNAL